jgi:hypothetical protein
MLFDLSSSIFSSLPEAHTLALRETHMQQPQRSIDNAVREAVKFYLIAKLPLCSLECF